MIIRENKPLSRNEENNVWPSFKRSTHWQEWEGVLSQEPAGHGNKEHSLDGLVFKSLSLRKMLMITLYAEQREKKRHRFIEQSFRLCGRRRGWDVSRELMLLNVVLEKTLESPLDWRKIKSNQSIIKEINPEYSLEGLLPNLKFQNFGHQCK